MMEDTGASNGSSSVAAETEAVTYLDIIELYEDVKEQTQANIVSKFKEKWTTFRDCQCSDKTLYNKITRVFKRSKTEKRNCSKDKMKLEAWLSTNFALPQPVSNDERRLASCMTEKERQLSRALSKSEAENKDLKRHCSELELSYEEIKLEIVRINARYDAEFLSVTEELAKAKQQAESGIIAEKALKEKTEKLDLIQNELNAAHKKLKRCNVRNLNKKINRRDEKLEEQGDKLEEQGKKLEDLAERNQELVEQATKLKTDLG